MIETAPVRTNALKEIGTAVRHSAVYGLGSILAKILGFVMLPFYTHYLGPRDYGLLEIMDLSISLFGMVLHMGIAPALLRSYAAAPTPAEKNKAVSTVFIFVGTTGLLTFICGLAVIRPISNALLPGFPSKYLLLAFSSFVLSYMAGPFRAYLRAREASARLTMFDTGSTLLVFLLNIYFIAVLKLGILGILLSPVIVNAAWVVVAAGSLLGVGLGFSRNLLRQMVHFGLPLIFSNLAAFVLNFADRFFLQHFQSLEVVGLYAVGYKFGFMINVLLVQPFMLMWQARMYVIYANREHASIFGQIFALYSMALTYSALAMALLSPEIIHVMAGPKFAGAGKVIPLISLAYVVCGVGSYLQTGLYLINRTKLIGLISAVSAVVSLALYYVLISRYGMLGAGWATVLSFGTLAAGSYWYSQKYCPLGLELGRMCGGFALAVLLYLPFQWWRPTSFALLIPSKLVVLAIFPIMLWKFQVLSRAEIATVSASWTKVYGLISAALRSRGPGKEASL